MPLVKERVKMSKLWEVYTDVQIGEDTVYIRALSEIEKKMVDDESLMAVQSLREQLVDTSSKLYKAKVGQFANADRKRWEDRIVIARLYQFRQEAQQVIFPQYVPPPPDDEPSEGGMVATERFEALEARQRAEHEYQDNVVSFIRQKVDALRQHFTTLNDDEIRSQAMECHIEVFLRDELNSYFRACSIWLACYRDETLTKRQFSDVNEVLSIKSDAIAQKLAQVQAEVNYFDPLS